MRWRLSRGPDSRYRSNAVRVAIIKFYQCTTVRGVIRIGTDMSEEKSDAAISLRLLLVVLQDVFYDVLYLVISTNPGPYALLIGGIQIHSKN